MVGEDGSGGDPCVRMPRAAMARPGAARTIGARLSYCVIDRTLPFPSCISPVSPKHFPAWTCPSLLRPRQTGAVLYSVIPLESIEEEVSSVFVVIASIQLGSWILSNPVQAINSRDRLRTNTPSQDRIPEQYSKKVRGQLRSVPSSAAY